jgi:hypothetical protein
VLEPTDDRACVRQRLGQLALDDPELGAELVERPVRADARGVLVYARTTGETGRTSVARSGIEARDGLSSGRHASASSGLLRPWTGQYEMCNTSLCLAS